MNKRFVDGQHSVNRRNQQLDPQWDEPQVSGPVVKILSEQTLSQTIRQTNDSGTAVKAVPREVQLWDSYDRLASVVFIVTDFLRLSGRHILTSPALLLPVIGAGGFTEGVAVMPHSLVVVGSPLGFAFAALSRFARFHVSMLCAKVVFALFVASVLSRIVLSLMVAIRCRSGHYAHTH